MTATSHLLIGTALVVAGAVLALTFPDIELLWFRGRPLGVVLVVLGVLDIAQGVLGRRR